MRNPKIFHDDFAFGTNFLVQHNYHNLNQIHFISLYDLKNNKIILPKEAVGAWHIKYKRNK